MAVADGCQTPVEGNRKLKLCLMGCLTPGFHRVPDTWLTWLCVALSMCAIIADRRVPVFTHWDRLNMDASISSTVNTALALQDANLTQEIQARVLKKALNAQADTALTLMQSLPVLAVDATLGSRIDTHA